MRAVASAQEAEAEARVGLSEDVAAVRARQGQREADWDAVARNVQEARREHARGERERQGLAQQVRDLQVRP